MRVMLLGVVVEHRLHNAAVVDHYVIMNSYVPCVCVQAGWYHPCNTNQRAIRHSPGPESSFLFSWYDLKRKFKLPAGVKWFIIDRDSGLLLWLAHLGLSKPHINKPTESCRFQRERSLIISPIRSVYSCGQGEVSTCRLYEAIIKICS